MTVIYQYMMKIHKRYELQRLVYYLWAWFIDDENVYIAEKTVAIVYVKIC